MTTVLYRYRDVCNEDGSMYLIEDEYAVLKTTPCGWWVCRHEGLLSPEVVAHRLANRRAYGVRFVLSGPGKRYAYPDKADALGSYRARKARQLEIARWSLERAACGLKAATRMLETGDDLQIDRWGYRHMGNPYANSQFEVQQ